MIFGLLLFCVYFKYFYTPYFNTSCKLLIRDIQNQDIVARFGNESTLINPESNYSNPMLNLTQVIQSEELASKIYERIELIAGQDLKAMGIRSRKDWYYSYLNLIHVKTEPTTSILNINIKWVNKENTICVLNVLVNEFKKLNIEIRKSVETQQTKYLNAQVKDIENKLTAVRDKIRIYSLKTKTIDTNSEGSELIKARVDLLKELENVKSDISYYDKKFSNLSMQLGLPDAKTALRATAIGEDPYLIKLNQNMSDAQQNYAKLYANYTDKHPLVIAAKKELDVIKKNITNRERESLGKIVIKRGIYDKPSQDIVTEMARVQAEKVSLVARRNALDNCVSDLMKKESEMPDKIFELEELKKDEEALLTAYNNARQKQMEANIKEHFIVDNIYQLGQPSEPLYLGQSIIIKLMSFICFGFMLVLGLLWIKEEIQDKWESSDEIEQITGIDVLGAIPWDVNNDVFSEIALNCWAGQLLDTAYKKIAGKLISKAYNSNSQSIAFISTADSRKRPTIVTRLAIAMAKLDKKVIVIDTNFTDPQKLIKEFNLDVDTKMGKDIIEIFDEVNTYLRLNRTIEEQVLDRILCDSLISVEFNTEKGDQKAFSYLCSYKRVENIYDYVATNGIEVLINYLKNIYEFIIIETPEKSFILPEFTAISKVSDAVVFISAMNSNKELLISLINEFEHTSEKILGIITREMPAIKSKFFDIKKILFEEET